jgi:hypothetical protein
MTHGSGDCVNGSSYLAISSGRKSSDGKRAMARVWLPLGRRYGGRAVLLNRPSAGRYASECNRHANQTVGQTVERWGVAWCSVADGG